MTALPGSGGDAKQSQEATVGDKAKEAAPKSESKVEREAATASGSVRDQEEVKRPSRDPLSQHIYDVLVYSALGKKGARSVFVWSPQSFCDPLLCLLLSLSVRPASSHWRSVPRAKRTVCRALPRV